MNFVKPSATRPSYTEDDGSPALSQWLQGSSAELLDVVTRQFLVFAYAIEAAARGQLSSQELSHLSLQTGTADAGGLLAHLPVQPEANGNILAALRLACLQVGTAQPAVLTGRFISLEGGDGSGKTTLSKLLAEKLGGIATRALGGAGGVSLELRALILKPDYVWHPLAELLLTTAIYRETLMKVLVPVLAAGQTVVSDRWADTLVVYMPNSAGGVEPAHAAEAYNIVTADIAPALQPHCTFILDLTFEQAQARRTARPLEASKVDRNEAKGDAFHARVFEQYRLLAGSTPRCVLVNAAVAQTQVLEQMQDYLQREKATA